MYSCMYVWDSSHLSLSNIGCSLTTRTIIESIKIIYKAIYLVLVSIHTLTFYIGFYFWCLSEAAEKKRGAIRTVIKIEESWKRSRNRTKLRKWRKTETANTTKMERQRKRDVRSVVRRWCRVCIWMFAACSPISLWNYAFKCRNIY